MLSILDEVKFLVCNHLFGLSYFLVSASLSYGNEGAMLLIVLPALSLGQLFVLYTYLVNN